VLSSVTSLHEKSPSLEHRTIPAIILSVNAMTRVAAAAGGLGVTAGGIVRTDVLLVPF
jgi:hypothetical protein